METWPYETQLTGTARRFLVADDAGDTPAQEALANRYTQLQVIYHMTNAVSRAGVLAEIYQIALDGLQQALQIDRSAILMIDPDGVMRFKAWRGLSDGYRAAVEGHSPWLPAEPNPQPVLVDNAAQDASIEPFRAVIEAEDIQALAFIPLVYDGKLLGKFMLYCRQPYHFTAGEIQVAQTIAGQIAFATARKRAENEREELIVELKEALAQVKTLSGLLPICAACKKIRNDEGYWQEVEIYILERSEANFSHGICPDCMKRLYPDYCHCQE